MILCEYNSNKVAHMPCLDDQYIFTDFSYGYTFNLNIVEDNNNIYIIFKVFNYYYSFK